MKQTAGEKVKILIKDTREITAHTDETLLNSLTAAGFMLEAACGGQGSCGKCRIKVLSGPVFDRYGNPAEPNVDGSYLACQVYPVEDLVIDKIGQANVSQKGEIGDISLGREGLFPPVRKFLIKPTYPTLENNFSLQEVIAQAAGGNVPVDIFSLRELALVALEKVEQITLTLVSNRITAVESGDTTASLYGVAFDIGSTTVAGMLVDLNKGQVIAAASETNPQAPYGADVISRIKAAKTDEGLEKLAVVIRECLNNLISRLCINTGILNRDIYLVTVAGNSTMEHLLMGVAPTCLANSPYVTVFKNIPEILPSVLDININQGGRIILLPNIASFVGADTVAAAIAVDQDITSKMTLLIDLGTNGEMVLGNKDKLIVCSTAAGPAFEGGQLSSGMRAADGAIDDVVITDDVLIRTIKNAEPKGICGSGVIKAIAELVKSGVLLASGRFAGDVQVATLPESLRKRIQEKDGQKEFVLVFAEESATGRDISITQLDIREIQLVKSSIYTGAQILMESFDITVDQVEQILIAGAFGNYIDLDSALAIGLVPQTGRDKIRPVGNAAGTGAVKALLSEKYLERSHKIASQAGFIELANHEGFKNRFIKNLAFPEVSR